MSAMKRQNIILEPEVFEEFCRIAGKKGIKISTWINQKMKELLRKKGFWKREGSTQGAGM